MKINILLPVFNDWRSLNFLLIDIHKKLKFEKVDIIVIDDCSTVDHFIDQKFSGMNIKILRVNKNVGSQKAINIGLNYLQNNSVDKNYCVVMDSDGEDKAEDIKNLIDAGEKNKDKIVFASRGKRQDGFIFYILYKIYLFLFFILTGKNIDCGNFSCIPQIKIKEIVELEYSGIHHSASILKSGLDYKKVLCDRGKRYKGKSQMSLGGLVSHGINSMAIFYELIIKRFSVFFISVICFLFLIFFLSIFIKDQTINNVFNLIIDNSFFSIGSYFFSFFIFFLIYLRIIKSKFKSLNFDDIIVKKNKII